MRDEAGRRFFFVCPRCGRDVEGCPDPACRDERVGHHVAEAGCDDDVPLTGLARRYVDPEPGARPSRGEPNP